VSGAYADGAAFAAGSDFPESGRDNYDLSRCLGVRLRIDMMRTGVQALIGRSAELEAARYSNVRIALYETDSNQANPADDLALFALQPLTGDLPTASNAAAKIAPLEMYWNNALVKGDDNFDMDTYLDANLAGLNALLPARGATAAGLSPDQVLFIVTDGLNDMLPRRTYAPMDWSGANCASIRKKGVRIAVIYTTYQPRDDPWFLMAVAPALPKGLPPGLPASTPAGADPMALAAQQCASPGLYEEVGADGDIPAAMQRLFERAVRPLRRGV
jgi:hypothetical protein